MKLEAKVSDEEKPDYTVLSEMLGCFVQQAWFHLITEKKRRRNERKKDYCKDALCETFVTFVTAVKKIPRRQNERKVFTKRISKHRVVLLFNHESSKSVFYKKHFWAYFVVSKKHCTFVA
jgi:hypothetical protein